MEYRIGKCSDCGAEFKVPASFAHDVARCKECRGVVHLGPPGGPAPSAPAAGKEIPARKVAPKGAKRPEGADSDVVEVTREKKKGDTLARLKAQREQAAAAAKPTRPAQAARPAPKAQPSKKPARPVAAAASKPTGAARGRTGAKASGAARGAGARSSEGGSARRSRRGAGAEKEKKNMLPALLSVVLLVAIGGGVFAFKDSLFGSGTDGVQAEESAQQTDTAAETDEAPLDDMTEGNEDAATEEAPADPEPEKEASPFEEKKPKVADPSSVDLSTLPDYGPGPGCSDEKFAELTELMSLYMDLDAGAKGMRAGNKLQDEGHFAFPVILNHMKTLDFGTEAGHRAGDMCQKALERICHGINFGWKYNYEDPADVLFNKKVVTYWAGQWDKVVDQGIEYFIKMAKLDEKEPEEAKRLREEYGGVGSGGGDEDATEPPADVDDLDVD